MFQKFEEVQKLNKENLDLTVKSLTSLSKGYQAIASELVDFSRKSFEETQAVTEKLLASKSVETAIAVQTDFVKASYEGGVARATKIGEMFSALSKEALEPIQTMVAKAVPAAK